MLDRLAVPALPVLRGERTIRLISAEDIGRTMAESWLRFPAPITTDWGSSA
jgi:hypothetical protein